MKNWKLFLLCMLALEPLRAQSWQEIFHQDKTQITYLTQQVTLLETYGKLAKKGYDISREGLGAVLDLKARSYNLHQGYYQRLATVSTTVLHDSRTVGIVTLQAQVLRAYHRCMILLDSHPQVSWLRTCTVKVFGQLMTTSARELGSLKDLTQGRTFSLSTEERLQRIDALYQQAERAYGFARHFVQEVSILLAQGTLEASASRVMESLYANPRP